MADKKILYKVKKQTVFSRLEHVNISGEENKEIAEFFRNKENFKLIFPSFIPLKSNFEISKGSIVDNLCLDPKRNVLFVVEYKSIKNQLLSQVARYLRVLNSDKNWKDKEKLSKVVNEVIPVEKGWGEWFDKIKWEKSKIICMAPDFYEYEVDFEDEKIIWIWLEWYQENNNERTLLLEMDNIIYQEMIGQYTNANGGKIPAIEVIKYKNESDENIKKWAKETQNFVVDLDPTSLISKEKINLYDIWNKYENEIILTIYFYSIRNRKFIPKIFFCQSQSRFFE
ncbi:MAG: hypothetical protein I3273_07180 [Candidatus Moeniiplasma glomeromycotorum]|nr:hypothetical protein [Candidatus Moeniiplasma glomeromycotorum]MCE8168377.1 hypothetical protein [Candidatus Moeniiplasma glomeromycotorum]MCE8169869.1 hypothetical protein [Candidatus Moeniiplasma glomeromycotorum]